MAKYLLAVLLLTGCAQPDLAMQRYSQDEARKAMHKMVFCANAVKKFPIPLDDAEKNFIYTDCLIQNNATI